MHRKQFLAVLAAGFVGGLVGQLMVAGGGLTPAVADGSTGDIKIGFVDVKKVFEKYEKTKDREKQINDEFRLGMEELRVRKVQLEEKKDEILLFGPNSPERRKAEKDLALEAFHIEFQEQWLREKVKDDLKRSTESLYAEIITKVGEYAEKSGYVAIFKIDEEDIQSFTRNELKLKIHTRSVLYNRPIDDLTDGLIEFLNK